ncbi:hypothetical protein TraAM80_10536, partial [Trypanosoma rangeli]
HLRDAWRSSARPNSRTVPAIGPLSHAAPVHVPQMSSLSVLHITTRALAEDFETLCHGRVCGASCLGWWHRNQWARRCGCVGPSNFPEWAPVRYHGGGAAGID